MARLAKTKPLFLFLLPFFFILNGFTSYYNLLPLGDSFLLILLYVICAIAITAIAWLFYRDTIKAAILAFCLMAYHLFFGNIQDGLKELSGGFISQYRFILTLSFILFLAIIIWLKKRKKPLHPVVYYLNIVLTIFILIDMGRLFVKMGESDKRISTGIAAQGIIKCDTCYRPDIYLILLDQYAGSTALKDVFDFDNSGFESELTRRGFHIVRNSSSNYNLTPFSLASILDMDYLSKEMGIKKHLNVGYSYHIIRNSRVLKFLTDGGYHFYNYSVFDFPGQPAHEYGAFLPYGTKLITSQTLTSRLSKDIRADILAGKLGFKSLQKKIAYEYLHFNNATFDLTRSIATQKTREPKFVYAHFMLPHYPYYFDSKGNPLPLEKLSGFRKTSSRDYIEYLQYGNQKIMQLVDQILSSSATPPVVMLLSDHGFRHPERETLRKYDFINLNAIYLPGGNYGQFHDGMTNVNQFRVLFNACFNQRFPLLKDSTVDLWD